MGCDDVKRVLYFFLDGALSDQQSRSVTAHLSLCPECEQRSRVHQRMRELFRRRLAPVPATERFKVRLTRTLRVFRADW